MKSTAFVGALLTGVALAPCAHAAATDSRFNPAISLVMQGKLNSYSQDPDAYALPGFQLGTDAGLSPEGPTLDETEITGSANVDQVFFAQSTFSYHDENGDGKVEVEEAFVDDMALPSGLGLRFGRFYSDIGYQNRFHSHAWNFQDEPLVYRAFLGGQYRDDGVQATWVAPTDMFLQFGAEALRGDTFPGAGSKGNFGDGRSLFVKLGDDFNASNAWQAGLSTLWEQPRGREGTGTDGAVTDYTGDSKIYAADFVWKWSPEGNPVERNFMFQAEYFWRDENGSTDVSDGANLATLDYKGKQDGWYAQAVYQFMPQWRVGVRYDWLGADNRLRVTSLGGFADPAAAIDASGLNDHGNPHRSSAMVDWSPSEFSRIRLQYNRDNSRPDQADNQVTLQYIMSLGAHGAHEF